MSMDLTILQLQNKIKKLEKQKLDFERLERENKSLVFKCNELSKELVQLKFDMADFFKEYEKLQKIYNSKKQLFYLNS